MGHFRLSLQLGYQGVYSPHTHTVSMSHTLNLHLNRPNSEHHHHFIWWHRPVNTSLDGVIQSYLDISALVDVNVFCATA